MIYALDTEFMEDGQTIELISLALVAEDGRELYIQNRNAQLHTANPWVTAHVLPKLEHQGCKPRRRTRDVGRGYAYCRLHVCPWLWRDEMGDCIQGFLLPDRTPIFVGYYCDYDWVALCQLYGRMIDLPADFPMYCRDLRQWLDDHELEGVVQGDTDEQAHHALHDARWIMRTYRYYVLGEHGQHTPAGATPPQGRARGDTTNG